MRRNEVRVRQLVSPRARLRGKKWMGVKLDVQGASRRSPNGRRNRRGIWRRDERRLRRVLGMEYASLIAKEKGVRSGRIPSRAEMVDWSLRLWADFRRCE